MGSNWRKYLLWFAQEHVDFRFAEIDSLLSLLNIKMRHVEKPNRMAPYWIVEFLSEEDVKRLTQRSVSVRSCLELWGNAHNVETLHKILKKHLEIEQSAYFRTNLSFKIEVETFCRHFTQKEKVEKIETFSYLPVQGPVKLKNPDVCFQYIEYYGIDPNNPPEVPYQVFFGRLVANGLRQLIQKLSLKTRKFIGNTSMDPQLSVLMANQAKVQNGDLILDPFVGSGSLLVAAAEFGGYVFGSDIDYLMLHARTRPSRITQKKRDADESIRANMKQYGTESKYLDILINDFALPFWRDDVEFDAIITDPPYGIRESTERVGTLKESYSVEEKHLLTHIPAKIEYSISNIFNDLLIFAAKHLKVSGRLVCWFPVYREDYDGSGLPSHPCLNLVSNNEQTLSKFTARRLLTFEKTRIPNEAELERSKCEISDFRERYFFAREETRKERRTKEAANREQNKREAQERKRNKQIFEGMN